MKQTNRFFLQLFLFFIFLFIILVLSSCFNFKEATPDGVELVKVRITMVIDGDTAYARFPNGSEEKVRFIGVDAPEINHPQKGMEIFGPESTEYTREKIEGKQLWLEFDAAERDQYGRLLAYLWLEVPENMEDREIREKMFNAQLLIDGYAVQVIFPPNVKYVDYFTIYNNEARDGQRGLWSISEHIENTSTETHE